MSDSPPPPPRKKSWTWPIALNLGLLLLTALLTDANPNALAIGVVVLAGINGLAAAIMGFSGRVNYVGAFLLSALVLLLIGLGICALLLSNLHVNH